MAGRDNLSKGTEVGIGGGGWGMLLEVLGPAPSVKTPFGKVT